MINKKNIFLLFFYSVSVLIIISCAPSNPVNDFFGIKMHPLDEESFKIVSYSAKDGISYKNSIMMDPNLSAWAELSVDAVKIIVQNKTTAEIPLNYNVDEFVIVTDEKEYYLGKGDRMKYTAKSKIKPNSKFEISLAMPADYMRSAVTSNNYMDQTKTNKDFLSSYTTAGTKLDVAKENVKYILIKFGHSAEIVLKRVPEKPKLY